MKHYINQLILILITIIGIVSPSCAQTDKADSPSIIFPGSEWNYFVHPEHAGWDTSKLGSFKKYLIDSTCITGFMIIQKGKIVFQYGDIQEVSYIASCRKSILAMLYGEHIKSGEINLHTSLKDLNMDDIGGLLPSEKDATIEDIISARSGVYHPVSYPGGFEEFTPKRGSVKHGDYWFYNNWDFDVAGYIFEKETHRNIYDEVERMLAAPLKMQDWNRSLQHKEGDSTRSIYPGYPLYFSTRDMARIGLLMLNNGQWNNKTIIDSAWVAEMVKPRTGYEEVNRNIPAIPGYSLGYGYLWWIWQNLTDDRFRGGYSAMGKWGQSISVFPATDVVIACKTKAVYERSNSRLMLCKVLALALQAHR